MPNNSNLTSRVLVALVAIPALLIVAYIGGIFFFLFVAVVSALSLNEFYNLAQLKGASPQRALGVTAALLVSAAFFHEQIQ